MATSDTLSVDGNRWDLGTPEGRFSARAYAIWLLVDPKTEKLGRKILEKTEVEKK